MYKRNEGLTDNDILQNQFMDTGLQLKIGCYSTDYIGLSHVTPFCPNGLKYLYTKKRRNTVTPQRGMTALRHFEYKLNKRVQCGKLPRYKPHGL